MPDILLIRLQQRDGAGTMFEQAFYDLDAMGSGPLRRRTIDFTRADDPQWSGVVELGSGDGLAARSGQRTDVYVLHGMIDCNGEDFRAQDFLSLHDEAEIRAGDGGAVLFVYREPATERKPPASSTVEMRGATDGQAVHPETPGSKGRTWRAARVPGMRVADLTLGGYQLSLVHWQPGTQVVEHDHRKGEEIFVLEGELISREQGLPAGSWIRLRAGTPHTPYAKSPTLILLRNSHLPPGPVHADAGVS